MARMYAGTGGRFTSPDQGEITLDAPVTLNRYVYSAADPINYTDPDGNFIAIRQPTPLPPQNTYCPPGTVLQGNACIAQQGGFFWPWQTRPVLFSMGGLTFDPGDAGVAAVRGMFGRLQGMLKGDRTGCAQFLAGDDWKRYGSKRLDEKMTWLLKDKNRLGVTTFAKGTIEAPIAAVTTDDQRIIIGRGTPFFSAPTGFGLPDKMWGSLRYGSEQAQALILLHELGHVMSVLGPDADEKQNIANTQAVIDHCRDLIKSLKP